MSAMVGLSFGRIFKAFASPYGRSRSTTVSSTVSPQTASASATLTFTTANQILSAGNAVPAGYVDPAGVSWYAGTPANPLWLYFNRVTNSVVPDPSTGSSASTSAGGVWGNATTTNQAVQAAAVARAASSGPIDATSTAMAEYDVYGVQSAAQPTGGIQGVLMGRIRVEASADAHIAL